MDFEKEFEKIEENLRCPRCGGVVFESTDFEITFFYDHIREYSCIICGYRFWIDLEEIIYKVKLIKPRDN